jgi:hypothetical protein
MPNINVIESTAFDANYGETHSKSALRAPMTDDFRALINKYRARMAVVREAFERDG